jgi:hypothetical protein
MKRIGTGMTSIKSLVLVACVMLLPWQALAGSGGCMANLGRALACLEDRFGDPNEVSTSPEVPSNWKIPAGISLFVAGNALAFSFPVWALLGADVTTVTSVIIAGEVIEVVGILIMGDEAFDQLMARLREWRT